MTLSALKTKLQDLTTTYSDWFLPSKDELNQMYVNLHSFGVGGFLDDIYYSSSEVDNTIAYAQLFTTGDVIGNTKDTLALVRACRSFTALTGAYSLRDVGPAGGLIFYVTGTTYYEAAPSDISSASVWSNITNLLIGTTGTAIGTGQANTTAIIGQAGHTGSSAKLCNDLIVLKNNTGIGEVLFDWSEYANEQRTKTYPFVLWSLSGAKFVEDGRSTTIQKVKIMTLTVFVATSFDALTQDKITVWDDIEAKFKVYLNLMNETSGIQIQNIDKINGEYIGEGIISVDSELGIMYRDIQLKIYC